MSELQIITPVPSKLQVNPEVPVDIFETHAQARYWVGRVATMHVAPEGYEPYYDGLLEFRANVYIHELGFIKEFGPDGQPNRNTDGSLVLDEFGRETDDDDQRSVSFATIEHTHVGTDDESARVVGSGRLIVKYGTSTELPIEKHFPELFAENPLPDHVAEVSRFIARHDDVESFAQHKIALSVIRAMVHYCVENDIPDTYCLIEKPLVKLLSFIGLPLTILGEPKEISELEGVLYPVKIEPFEVIKTVKKDRSGTIHLKEFFGNHHGHTGNEAFYTDSLMEEA